MQRADIWEQIKWNGWGERGVYYELTNDNNTVVHSRSGVQLPKIVPFAKQMFGLEELQNTPSIDLEDVQLQEPQINEAFMSALKSFVAPSQISFEKEQRICHTYGCSFRDLWRLRKGLITEAPDCVVYPHSHDDVERIVRAAHTHGVSLVPAGGRTNIVGALEPERIDGRMIVSLDMRRMNRILWVDKRSMTACIEAGILGPDLENELHKEGLSLGHDPDSFQWSTLGGWIATCSSGMQSDKYGDIEDMCISLKVVTPAQGTIVTPPAPRNGSGPTLKHFFVGTEGVLGVITQAVMRVHKLPAKQEFHAFLFPSFQHGITALHSMVRKEAKPAMMRLYDPDETKLSFHMKPKSSPFVTIISDLMKKFLEKFKHFDMDTICLMIVGVEGEIKNVKFQKKLIYSITKEEGGFWIGQGPGKSWHEKRYDLPMLRDFMLDKGMWVDVAETAVSWSDLAPLWKDVKSSVMDVFHEKGVPGWIGAHISHSYSNGACIYFHFASTQQSLEAAAEDGDSAGQTELAIYVAAKKAATKAILRNRGALSHHHGVGFEHIPFMASYLGEGGIAVLRGLKTCLDPRGICNPGKLLPTSPASSDVDDPQHLFYVRGFLEGTQQHRLPAKL